MSNADLIEVMRYNFGRQFVPPKVLHEAADALDLADKRIAELEAERDEHPSAADYGELNERFNEAERKLDVAREAMQNLVAVKGRYHTEQAYKRIVEALAQIGEK